MGLVFVLCLCRCSPRASQSHDEKPGAHDDATFREALYRVGLRHPDVHDVSDAERAALAPLDAEYRDRILQLDETTRLVRRLFSERRTPGPLVRTSRRRLPEAAPLVTHRALSSHLFGVAAAMQGRLWREACSPGVTYRAQATHVTWRGLRRPGVTPVDHFSALYREEIANVDRILAEFSLVLPERHDPTALRESLECLASHACVDFMVLGQGDPESLPGDDGLDFVRVQFSLEGSRIALDRCFLGIALLPRALGFDEVALAGFGGSNERLLATCTLSAYARPRDGAPSRRVSTTPAD